jgi:hypothetical protein
MFGVRGAMSVATAHFEFIVARRVGGIDSIAAGHWIIDFHRSIFAHL